MVRTSYNSEILNLSWGVYIDPKGREREDCRMGLDVEKCDIHIWVLWTGNRFNYPGTNASSLNQARLYLSSPINLCSSNPNFIRFHDLEGLFIEAGITAKTVKFQGQAILFKPSPLPWPITAYKTSCF